MGKYLENIVYIFLRSRGYSLYSGELREGEVDLIAEKGDAKIYIQVAYQISHEDTYKREFGQLSKIKDHYEKLVVTADDLPLKGTKGIKHVLAWDFLTS